MSHPSNASKSWFVLQLVPYSYYSWRDLAVVDHAHVLTDDISAAIMANAKMNGSVVAAESDEDETEEDSGFVCTQPGCSRRFMHEHVQDSNASYLNTTSNEALADHVFTRC